MDSMLISPGAYLVSGDTSEPVVEQIAEDEAMYVREAAPEVARSHYFSSGKSALRCIRLALAAGEVPQVNRLLDLPCGHGRVFRHLAAAFPQAERHAADLLTAGVQFCVQNFGAIAVPSHPDPRQVQWPGDYDLIWVGSLFTHLDAPQWRTFFEVLHQALRPGGVCVFTTHGRKAANLIQKGITNYGLADAKAVLERFLKVGFAYQSYSSTDSTYGISLSSLSWVLNELSTLPNARIVLTLEHGWAEHQDVLAWQKLP